MLCILDGWGWRPEVPDNATRPDTKVDTGTASFGGPVLRNRLFFYGGWEQTRRDLSSNSPITFANGLKGNLLIIHGTGDDNVHYQGTEALINALVAANKQFSTFSYPNRSHSISEGTGTQRHLLGMMTKYLNERLPAGPAPATTSSTR